MTESSQLSRTPPPVELRYFAARRDDWELLLLRARQLGADTIAARVPWAWHAPTPGALDFHGATDGRRDLVGFVRLCERLGLHVLLDPGPLHGDLLGGGAPAWLLQQHPGARARGWDGAPRLDTGGLPHPNPLHPEFLTAARGWVAAFSADLRALQGPSGPIVALYAGDADTPTQIGSGQDHDSNATGILDWLRADGWTVPLRRGRLSRQPPGSSIEPGAEPGGAVLLELPGGPNHVLLDAAPSRSNALLRSDGSARPDFWRIKIGSLLIATAGADTTAAGAPADMALADMRAPRHPEPARTATSTLEQRLRQANVTFATLDLDAAPPQDLARYALIVVPDRLAYQPATQQKLAQCSNIMVLSDQSDSDLTSLKGPDDISLSPRLPVSQSPRLPADISADQLAELIEQRGGIARYAWADGADVDLMVRYGVAHTYLSIDNRRLAPYNGILAYRGRDGAVLHLHAGIGAGRMGMVLLTDDEVYGAAIDGDGAEGGWLARGLRSSAVFNSGAGALARCGEGLLLTAPQSGRFQARRAEGWAHMRAHRLLLSGALLPARAQIDATHIAVAYVAEDAWGQTDMYIVLPDGEAPALVRRYLATVLAARAARLRRAEMLAEGVYTRHQSFDALSIQAVEPLGLAAGELEAAAEQVATLDAYSAAWSAAEAMCQPARAALAQMLAQAHGALLAEKLDPTAHEALERQITRIINIAALAN
jgi:hypothetical protein